MASAERFVWPRSLLNFQVFDKWVGAFPSCVESFIDAILEDRPASPDFTDGWRVQQVMDAALRSQETGAWVTVG